MLPPVSQTLVKSNPQFAILYKHLTEILLDKDASTQSKNAEHAQVADRLAACQIQLAKEQIVRDMLQEIVGTEQANISSPLLNTVVNYISEGSLLPLSEEDHNLMSSEIGLFQEALAEISNALSSLLQQHHHSALSIASQATATAPPPTNHISAQQSKNQSRHIQLKVAPKFNPRPSQLQESIQSLLSSSQNPNPSNAITTTTILTASLLPQQTDLLTASITHLEQHTHGSISRHQRSRAEHLSAVSSALALKIQVTYLQTLKELYSPEMQRALEKYERHLLAIGQGLGQREKGLREVCGEYDEVELGFEMDMEMDMEEKIMKGGKTGKGDRNGNGRGGQVMRELGRTYGQVLKEIEEVKADIETLKKNRNGGGTSAGGSGRGGGGGDGDGKVRSEW